MKYTISTNETSVIFTDNKGKSEKFEFIAHMSNVDAIASLRKEITARHSASQATLSILVDLMDTPKLDSYKGATPANEGLTKEYKAAVREIEGEYLKPLFTAPLIAKGNNEATVQKLWTTFIEDLRAGGVWSNVGATVRQYFAICGKLPCLYINGQPQKDKLLSTHAMQKEIANLRTAEDTTDTGIAGKLSDLLTMVKERNEKTKLGHTGTAIACLKSLLAEFEAIDRYEREQAMIEYQKKADAQGMKPADKPDVAAVAVAVVQKAQGKKNKGQVSPKSKTTEQAPF